MTDHSSPVNAELLADRLQRVIDSFDAQRQKYHNNASDPGFNGMQQEAWASLANEKADDLRVLRKLLGQSGIRAQQMRERPEAEYVKAICKHLRSSHPYSGITDKNDVAAADLIEVLYLAALPSFSSPEHQSAPAYAAAHNSGEGDPSVMPDYVGADTAIQPQCAPHPIETAPKDGTHILAWRVLTGIRTTNNTHPPTVVHWFDDPDEPGFYTSVNERAPEHPFSPTHWMPLPNGPALTRPDDHRTENKG